jgi:hypothetical protein
MVLFQINSPSITVDPLKGDGPGPIYMYTVSLRFSFQAMEIESWNLKIFKPFRNVQRHQPSSTTLNQISAYSARVILFEQPGQPFMAKTFDHN